MILWWRLGGFLKYFIDNSKHIFMQQLLKNKCETGVNYLNKCASFSAMQYKWRTENLLCYLQTILLKQFQGVHRPGKSGIMREL